MELIRRTKEFGVYTVDREERKAIQDLNEIFEEEIERQRRQGISISEYIYDADAKKYFVEAFTTLLPDIKDDRSLKTRLHTEIVVNRDYCHSSSIKSINVKVKTHFLPDRIVDVDATIQIMPLPTGTVYLALHLPDYKPSCVDDVVTMLGKGHTPAIQGVQYSPKNGSTIAEVAFMPIVHRLYEKAQTLLRLSTGPTVEELNMIRTSALQSENIALRKISIGEYQRCLGELLLTRLNGDV